MKIKTTIGCFFLLLLSLIVVVHSQICNSTIPYSRCSSNSACGCFPTMDTPGVGVCAFLWKPCSQLVPCGPTQECMNPDHICIHHSRCRKDPVCYPVSMMDEPICPSMPTKVQWKKWKQEGKTVAGGNGRGSQLNQFDISDGIFLDRNRNLFIADCFNDRIMKWKLGEQQGTIVAGGNGRGNRLDQLDSPMEVIVDEQNSSLIIADCFQSRVVRWFNESQQEILIENFKCVGIAMDKHGFLYVSNGEENQVRRWKLGEKGGGTLVAGGNGEGNQLNQFIGSTFIFVDDEQSVYVSDTSNHRVMKWRKGAREGVVVAGGNGKGNNLNQLNGPAGLFVDNYGRIYVADGFNHRITRWSEGVEEGEILIGGNGRGPNSSQLDSPSGLVFDEEGNLYVSDSFNNRIQKFDLIV